MRGIGQKLWVKAKHRLSFDATAARWQAVTGAFNELKRPRVNRVAELRYGVIPDLEKKLSLEKVQ